MGKYGKGNKRKDAKRDSNEGEIIEGLQQAGAKVVRLNERDVPDLLILFRGEVYLAEIKTPKGKLSEGQSKFINDAGSKKVFIARTLGEALYSIGAVGSVNHG